MKKLVCALALLATALAPAAAQQLKTTADSMNYAIGLVTIENMNARVVNWDASNKELQMAGMENALHGKTPLLTVEEGRKLIRRLEKEIQVKNNAVNKAEGEAFLKKNGQRPEVTTTASGLQYETLQAGTGTVRPVDTSYVRVHYHGTTLDGKIFDSSVDRGKPAEFEMRRLVPGFQEALKTMTVGQKIKAYIPQNLAYGEKGAPASGPGGAQIKPFSTIVFELELLELLDPATAPKQKPRPAPQMMPAGAPGKPGSLPTMPGQTLPTEPAKPAKPRN